MTDDARLRPLKEAGRITKMLDTVFGTDRFDRGPVDIANLALEYSANVAPDGRIHDVVERDIPGCVGALVCSETQPRQWAIMYNLGQSAGRRAFTIGHEFGHYVLHRQAIETDDSYDLGIYCDEEAVTQRSGHGIEQEADAFAAALLMPFHDFRAQLSAKTRPNFDVLGTLAKRYGVSLTAAILRWLEYTETRAMLVVSNEGFAHWAKPSRAALRSGRYIRTKNEVFELPALATAVIRDFTEEAKAGIPQDLGVWFPEPVVEMCLRSDRYDQELTLLHFESSGPCHHDEEAVPDSFDRFQEG
ncbi:ImmA/IrrE family metallo-endopeptidase [Novosphingobium sp. RD2P27]|uniref:ImmA/IrrE family metallo-endopeptidase n=1 Tax=Novosphingobium kalidii TaxID=3230299 RepID=A0ABV2D305_9SPHN